MISLVYLPSIANDLTISIQDYLSLRFRYSIAVVLFTQPLEYLLKFIQRFLGSYKIECKWKTIFQNQRFSTLIYMDKHAKEIVDSDVSPTGVD